MKHSERMASAKGFAVAEEMAGAALLELDRDQRYAVRRNDRPGEANNLVFVFRLHRVDADIAAADGTFGTSNLAVSADSRLHASTEVHVRAPVGYAFPGDCEVVTAKGDVFTRLNMWPAYLNLSEWTAAVGEATSCEGRQNIAIFRIVGGQGMLPLRKYAFRINLLSNPLVTPSRNSWALPW